MSLSSVSDLSAFKKHNAEEGDNALSQISDLSAEFPTLKNSIKKFKEPYPMIDALNKAIKKATAADQKTSVTKT